MINQIKLQRLRDNIGRNVVDLESSHNTVSTKDGEPVDSKIDIVELEHALAKMKMNLTNSRKKNEIITD